MNSNSWFRMEYEALKVSKDTQKFVKDLSELKNEDYKKVMDLLEALKKQQDAEANLESKRGWRYMWQRTPKPYLLMLGYLVFFASVGSFGYNTFSRIEELKIAFLIVFGVIMISPLIVVSLMSYHYMKHNKSEKEGQERKFWRT